MDPRKRPGNANKEHCAPRLKRRWGTGLHFDAEITVRCSLGLRVAHATGCSQLSQAVKRLAGVDQDQKSVLDRGAPADKAADDNTMLGSMLCYNSSQLSEMLDHVAAYPRLEIQV